MLTVHLSDSFTGHLDENQGVGICPVRDRNDYNMDRSPQTRRYSSSTHKYDFMYVLDYEKGTRKSMGPILPVYMHTWGKISSSYRWRCAFIIYRTLPEPYYWFYNSSKCKSTE